MRLPSTLVAAGALALALSSCAGGYRPIFPAQIHTYQNHGTDGNAVEFGYQYSALQLKGGNRKYIKKERKRGYQTVAVRIKNNTAAELNFSRDLELYFGERPAIPVPSLQAANDLKQGVVIYLLYALLNFNVGGTFNPQTGQTTGATFIPTGPFIAAGNMIGAGTANTNLRKEFVTNDLTNKIIRPGETVYGIISLREMNIAPLRLVLRNPAAAVPASAPQPAAPAPVQPPVTSPVPTNGGQ